MHGIAVKDTIRFEQDILVFYLGKELVKGKKASQKQECFFHKRGLIEQDVSVFGFLFENRIGKGTKRDDLHAIGPGMFHRGLNQLVAHVLTPEFLTNFRMFDDHFIGGGKGVHHFRKVCALFPHKKETLAPGLFVMDSHSRTFLKAIKIFLLFRICHHIFAVAMNVTTTNKQWWWHTTLKGL